MSTTAPEDPRAKALARIEARRNFWRQTAGFAFVEIGLIVIWALTSPQGHFWPVWPGIFFVLATIAGAWRVYGEKPITEDQIQREIDRQGQQLSELHPNLAGFTGEAAEAYDAARGTYPPEVIEAIGLDAGSRVLDLGAGTGLLSQVLAAAGHDVIAVEPLADMRARLAEKLGSEHALEGTAEAIPLPDESVDAATAAESFHWFTPDPAAAELHRVIRPGGLVALLWRWPEWDHSTEWVAKVVAEVLPLRGDDHPAFTPDRGRDAFTRHGGFTSLEHTELRYPQTTDRESYLSWVRSWSLISKLPVAEREALLDRLRPSIPDTKLDVSVRVELWTARRI